MQLPIFVDLAPIESLLIDPLKRRLVLFAASLIALAMVLSLLRQIRRWMRRPQPVTLTGESQIIDLAALPLAQPGLTRLTVYHIPVRLALVVIAPLGRDADAPRHSEVPQLLDHVISGLGSLPNHDQTIVRIWPRQLSATGFGHSLTRQVRLPGDRGRDTPWCLVSGRTTFGGAAYAVGLALAAAAPNSLGLITLESEHQWLDVLRLRAS